MAEDNSRSNRFALYVAIGKIVAMMAQFVMPMFLTRFLTKADYGTYAQFYLVQGVLGSILCFGIQSNPYYFYPGSSNDRKKQVIWNTFFTLMLAGGLGAFILLIPFISDWLLKSQVLNDHLYLVIACIVFFVPTNLIDPFSVVTKNKVIAMFYHPLGIILKIISVISFALIFHSIQAIIGGILLLNILLFFIVLYCIVKTFPIHNTKDLFSYTLFKEQIKYSLPFGVSVILATTCNQIDKLLCVYYLTLEEYATYSIAFFGIPGVMQIYDSLCQVNVMNMAFEFKQGSLNGVIQLYQRFVIQTLSFSLPIIFVVFLFSPQIINFLFSDKYLSSTPFFRLYILTFILGMVGSGTILRAIGRTRLSMKAFILSTIICVPLTFIFISNYGIWGAIISALINNMMPKFFQIFFECRILKTSLLNSFPFKDILKIFLFSGMFLVPIIILNNFAVLSLIPCILLSVFYLLIVYSVEIKANLFLIDKSKVLSLVSKFHLLK